MCRTYMGAENHTPSARFSRGIGKLLRRGCEQHEHRKAVRPHSHQRKPDHPLEPAEAARSKAPAEIKAKSENIARNRPPWTAWHLSYDLFRFTIVKQVAGGGFDGLPDTPNRLTPNLSSCRYTGSSNVRAIMERREVTT